MKPGFVLDASALLAWLFGEPGRQHITKALTKGCLIASVNWCEVLQKANGRGIAQERLYGDLEDKQILDGALTITSFDEELAKRAATLHPQTQSLGLSLGDRACLALGMSKNLLVITANKVWAELDLPVEVQLIR
ncbi:type II toxin-antitoxin system VapC family toxin [Oscillatoria sp. CS-180]|uniref:type II toxin-antitoxin system VapC family toxin n=1 Tax=Oscillatoria sp. CS-180 TaxID=3021720 RepID=UPI00232C9C40|nr:type II toxin-antitoxin system VapC family toxin [Oscillatoria sp. CS-180]MDB9526981.1 type II toxin-antitoxin system VapC family toxin [Oscillatoria sp. CS-180]